MTTPANTSDGTPSPSVAAALPPAVGSSVLPVDSGATKKATAPGPGDDIPQKSVPDGGRGIPGGWEEAELVSPPTDETYSDPSFSMGPWPWSERPGEALGTVEDDGINTYAYPVAAASQKGLLGAYERDQSHPGSNLVSQSVDSAGWQQNTPSGRTGVRRTYGQDYQGVEPFWFRTSVRPTPQRVAQTYQGLDGSMSEYGGLANAGGNLAYQPPAQPAVTNIDDAPSATASVPSAGLNQWGSF
jgi:hypothetical protein